MIKKLVGFLMVLCMAFFIAGCSSTPDVSGTYLGLDDNNKPVTAIVLEKVSDNAYDYTFFIINWRTEKMKKDRSSRVVLNTEKKVLEFDNITPPNMFFNKDYSSITTVYRWTYDADTEFVYKKLSDSEMKQYQHLFE
ncbi:hypothetical protein [Negativicoccus succinicivorans]|uniref:hypothetical protein n=1 Tax=Negativicoccus succinicivorans TaxID=620903 RepID=UPI002352C4A6|nr:hypothetical protein [Negativicoccus succinicivorans]MBS5889729.1 hypothetical protein [Negativicoccus succinicivorans]MDU0986143.1 hypothetical protein [Negativicoccus succinicivorans]MDU1065718.1 hypothetical protein [Negativicoccus succinicivorans]